MTFSVHQKPGVIAVPRAHRPRSRMLPILVAGGLALFAAEFILRVLSLPAQWVPLLLGGTLLTCAIIVLGNTRKLLLIAILLGVPFSININFFYRDEMADLNAIGGMYLSMSTLALIVLYGLWFLDALGKRTRDTGILSLLRSDFILCVHLSLMILAALLASDVMLGFFQIVQLVQFFFLYIYLRHVVRDREDVKFVLTFLFLGLVAEGFIMLALRVIGEPITIMSIRARITDGGRVGGTVGGPNGASAYLTLLIAPAMGLFLSRVQTAYKFLSLTGVLVGIAGLIVTMSRGGWLGCAVSATVFAFFALRRRWLAPSAVFSLAVGAAIVILALKDPIIARLASSDEGAAYARWPLMQIAGSMIAGQPFLGVGTNNFAVHLGEYATGPLANEWLSTVHNRYLLIWAESGMFALISYLLFLGVTVRRGWLAYRRNDPFLSPIALGMMTAVVGFMVHMMVDIHNSGSPVELFFVIAALMAAMDGMTRREHDPEGSFQPAGHSPRHTVPKHQAPQSM